MIDYDTKDEIVYHLGASEKDAGKKLMMVAKYTDSIVTNAMDEIIKRLATNNLLELK